MSDRKVLVRNVSNGSVTIYLPNENFRRTFENRGSKVSVPFDILFEGLSESGVEVLFKDGYLMIDNKQDRIDLGLEEADEEIFAEMVKSDEEILAILRTREPIKIKALLEGLAIEQKKNVAILAIKNKITDYGTVELIKRMTSIDVAKAVLQENE